MFTGQALFPLLCLVNHSFEVGDDAVQLVEGRTMVRVEALRDVAEGEELCVSYIDETEPTTSPERAKALAAYGLVCACPRCVSQRAETS